MTIGLSSCEKQDKLSDDFPGQGAVKAGMVTVVTPVPTVALDNGPYMIPPAPGENDRGGNRTCEDVKAAFPNLFGPEENYDCGEKVDIDEYFEGDIDDETRMYIGDMFPNFSSKGVWVNDDGTIGFDTEGSLCVKAVIVKGSNNANVYVYPNGIDTDDFLASPELRNGNIPWVSNLTFCCSCEKQPADYVIALKSLLSIWDNQVCVQQGFGVSDGESYGSAYGIGMNEFDPLVVPNVYDFQIGDVDAGKITAQIITKEIETQDVDCMEIVVTMNDSHRDWLFWRTYLYFGTELGLTTPLLEYTEFDYKDYDVCASTHTFLIRLDNMTLVE